MASLSNINGLFDVHSTGAILFSTSHGTSGQILKSNGNAAPTWVDASTVIGGPYLPLAGGTLTGATATASGISLTVGGALSAGVTTITSDTGLIVYSSSNGVGANITFSDVTNRTQKGFIKYFHSDTASYGSGNAFIITGDQATMTILADGKLMYKEGVYLKPATGTGAGTRKDNLWDAAYNDKITGLAVTGTTTKTLTATQQDGGTLTATWTDNNTGTVTSVATGNGLTGGTITSTGTLTMASSYTGGFTFNTSVASPIHSGTVSTSGDGQNNYPFRLGSDYSAYMVAAASNTWGLFWAGNSGARYGTNGNGGPGDIWSNSTNPNEFCFVGGDSTRWSVQGSTGDTWQLGNIYLSGTFVRANNNLTLQVDGAGTPVSAITIDNVGSTTFSGYTYFPSYLFHEGDTNTRIQFTTGTITLRGDTSIVLDGPTTTNEIFTGTTAKFTQGVYDDSSGIRVSNPGGGSRTTQVSSTTGAIKITLPVSWTNTMMRMTIKVYEYTVNESFTLVCGGYNYSGHPAWINEFAYIESSGYKDRNFTVRMGHDGTKCCIYIGELTSTWTYTQIFVTDFEAGYSGLAASNWRSGWDVGFEASAFGTITYTETNPQINNWARNGQDLYYGSGTGSVGIGTTSPYKKLEVAGDLQLDASNANMWIKSGATGTNGFINWTFNSDSTVYIKTGIDYDTRASLGYHIDSGYPITIDCTTYIDFKRSAGVLGRWNSAGLGIGTTGPAASAKLTVMGNQTFGLPGNGTNTSGRFISIEGNTDSSGEGSGRIFFTEHNSTTAAMDKYGMSLGYRGGATSIVGASGNTWTGLTQIGNGQWGMWGHNNSAAGSLVMFGDRAATYVSIPSKLGISNTSPQTTLHTGPTTTITNVFTARFAASNFFASGGNSMFYVPDTAANIMMFGSNQFGTNQIEFYHKNPGTSQAYVGRISTSGSATSYVTSSDYRLKENIVPISDSISRLNQLKPSRFNFIEEPGKIVDGFIAHEVQGIVPEAIVGEKDEVDEDGGIIPQGIDQAKLVPLLVAAVQELEARVKELENK